MITDTTTIVCRICHGGPSSSDNDDDHHHHHVDSDPNIHLFMNDLQQQQQEEEEDLGPLISPCRCKGSISHVHRQCLNRYRRFHCKDGTQSLLLQHTPLGPLTSYHWRSFFRIHDRDQQQQQQQQQHGNHGMNSVDQRAFFQCTICGAYYLFQHPITGQLESFESWHVGNDADATHDKRQRRWWLLLLTNLVISILLYIVAVIAIGFMVKTFLWFVGLNRYIIFHVEKPIPTTQDLDRFMTSEKSSSSSWRTKMDNVQSPVEYANLGVQDTFSMRDDDTEQWQQFDMRYRRSHATNLFDNKDEKWVQFWKSSFWRIDHFHIFLGFLGFVWFEITIMMLFARLLTLLAVYAISTGNAHNIWTISIQLLMADTVPGLSSNISLLDAYGGAFAFLFNAIRIAILCWSMSSRLAGYLILRNHFQDDQIVDLNDLHHIQQAAHQHQHQAEKEIKAIENKSY